MSVWYNEIDKQKAAWLRELIKCNVIADGDVDERSIRDVKPADLVGYTQCHFFAGIGVWCYALRLAQWPDDRPVWTASLPCPGFSCAGKGEGFNDPRHLWSVFEPLVGECRPRVLFGEQADDAIGFGWLDLVSGDLEAAGYAVAAAVLGAHSAGAPHIRQRLYFCADAADSRRQVARQHGSGLPLLPARSEQRRNAGERSHSEHSERRAEQQEHAIPHGRNGFGRSGDTRNGFHSHTEGSFQRQPTLTPVGYRSSSVATSGSCSGNDSFQSRLEGQFGDVREWRGPGWLDPLTARSVAEAGATRGFWGDCDWWYGRDGKYRPAGPGIQPLAHGAACRVLRLRGYGDAINAETAKVFIESYLDVKR